MPHEYQLFNLINVETKNYGKIFMRQLSVIGTETSIVIRRMFWFDPSSFVEFCGHRGKKKYPKPTMHGFDLCANLFKDGIQKRKKHKIDHVT